MTNQEKIENLKYQIKTKESELRSLKNKLSQLENNEKRTKDKKLDMAVEFYSRYSCGDDLDSLL